MWMCWCVCDVKHLAPTVALNQLCSGPIMMTVTQTAAVGGVCLLCELTGYCVQATQWRWSTGKLNICQSHPWHTKTHRDVCTSEERGELLAKTGDSWKKRKKKQRFVCSWIMRVFLLLLFFSPQDIAFVHTLSQFAGLLSSSSWQNLGEHAFSLHARLTCCSATNTSRSRSRLGAWRGAKRGRAENRRRMRREKGPFLIFLRTHL